MAAVDPKALSRLEALPGSLGKVSLCAAVTLSIATYVSVHRWLAKRAAAAAVLDGDEVDGPRIKYGARSGSASRKDVTGAAAAGTAGGSGVSTAGDGVNASTVPGKGCSDAAGTLASSSPPPRPQLPPRNYFTVRASLHVKRHNAKLMEWYDAQLGIQLPFSPAFFELKKEERQAPLILLTFRTVREAAHRMAVTVEELYKPQPANTYSAASISRIADCAKIIGQTTTRIGSKDYPTAEYCYVDEHQAMNYVFSIFATHERLAVTVQYVAPVRVRSVLPTVVYDLVRLLTFAAPSPSPSYLLVSEPRLGLGFHLPLDFLVYEGLAESDGVEDRLFTSNATAGGAAVVAHGAAGATSGMGGYANYAAAAAASTSPPLPSLMLGASPGLPPAYPRGASGAAEAAAPYTPQGRLSTFSAYPHGRDDDAAWMVPYATAMSCGGRRVGLITSYEPADMLPHPAASGSGVFSGAGGGDAGRAAPGGAGGGGVPHAWRPYLEQRISKAVRQLGIVLSSSSSGGGGTGASDVHVAFASPSTGPPPPRQALLVEPYPLSIALGGNFCPVDDLREEDSDAVAHVTAFSLCREVRVDVNSSYLTLVPDALDGTNAAAAAAAAARSRSGSTAGASVPGDASAGTVKAYWSAFYVPVGTACVSFHFIASAQRHTSTEFVSFCAAVMNGVTLGNHHGQGISVLYCNTRHDALPFRLSLPPTGLATAEEPMLADPLCVVQATYGVEKVAVTVRVFPLFTSTTSTEGGGGVAAASAGADGRPPTPSQALPPPPVGERRGTRQRSAFRQLQYMVRYYLAQFPGGVQVLSHERTTMNAMPALRVAFRPLWYAGDGGSGGGDGGVSSSAVPPAAFAVSNGWDETGTGMGGGGGGSSQVTSDWLGAREALLEEEVGQLNPFAQYFPPPPPPASYLWGPQQPSASPPAAPPTAGRTSAPVTAAALRKVGAGFPGSAGAADGAGAEDGAPFYAARGDGSQRSQAELNDPLRVAVAVCCEGNAFLFQASASEYTMGVAAQAVQTLATYLAPIPRGS